MNEKYKFTIDKLVSIKEIIKSIEETNYIDGYLGYEDGFYIDSILYYLKENARLKEKNKKALELLQILHYNFPDYDDMHKNIEDIEEILKEN